MIHHNADKLLAAFAKSGETEMQLAANSRTAMATTRKVLAAHTQVSLEVLDRIANYLGLDVEIRYIPREQKDERKVT